MNLSRVTRLKSRLVAGAGVASVLLVTSGAIAAPQLVLVNAKVFTADPALPYAQAVAIEDGRILAVDSNEKVRPLIGPNTRIIDAGGRLVTPGLIEAHRGLKITEEQRERFVELYLAAADRVGLPADHAFREALHSHIEFGSQVAKQNSHAETDDQLHPLREVPLWQWSDAAE